MIDDTGHRIRRILNPPTNHGPWLPCFPQRLPLPLSSLCQFQHNHLGIGGFSSYPSENDGVHQLGKSIPIVESHKSHVPVTTNQTLELTSQWVSIMDHSQQPSANTEKNSHGLTSEALILKQMYLGCADATICQPPPQKKQKTCQHVIFPSIVIPLDSPFLVTGFICQLLPQLAVVGVQYGITHNLHLFGVSKPGGHHLCWENSKKNEAKTTVAGFSGNSMQQLQPQVQFLQTLSLG